MHHIVYKITNRDNGKIYIGKHSTDDLNDGYLGSGTLIQAAVKKHGAESFEKIVLEEHETSELAYDAEVRLIAEHNSQTRDIGYNLQGGGNFGAGFPLHEETRSKISRALKGKKKPLRSEEHRQRLSAAKQGTKKSLEERARLSEAMKSSPNVGHPITQETKVKIAESLRHQVQSQETRDKRSASLKKQTPEMKARRAASIRAAWARKKTSLSGGSLSETALLVETSRLHAEDVGPATHTEPVLADLEDAFTVRL